MTNVVCAQNFFRRKGAKPILQVTVEKQEIMLGLFKDYRSNVALYPKFHEWLTKTQAPTLVV